ncbi:hypothetical protein EDEG_02121 [Edhazardia aedis USNM 41457]|uniref:Uncharacterized protein n=1 Tax=Edhazardia aedis (strain USNM 41457) TaxID=1003232 RepID=J9DQC7_EDHAE|nr:hypothetical protein EDEG_02121 [Edhazardia aedis USNM 41457]|eukprot:EJW03537.1 hypothetical protein EDEG_02121 [Edhazardia aedis USNM 41457]
MNFNYNQNFGSNSYKPTFFEVLNKWKSQEAEKAQINSKIVNKNIPQKRKEKEMHQIDTDQNQFLNKKLSVRDIVNHIETPQNPVQYKVYHENPNKVMIPENVKNCIDKICTEKSFLATNYIYPNGEYKFNITQFAKSRSFDFFCNNFHK